MPKEKYNKAEKIRLFVPNNDKAKISVTDGDKEITPNLNYEKEYIKNDMYYYNIKNINTHKQNYFEFDIDESAKNIDKIYKIQIKLDYYDIITLVSSHYDVEFTSMNYTYPEEYTIIDLKNNKHWRSFYEYILIKFWKKILKIILKIIGFLLEKTPRLSGGSIKL